MQDFEPLTFRHWLRVLAPHVSEHLVDPVAFERLEKVSRHVPGDVLTALELRLARNRGRVDLSVRLTRPDQAGPLLPHLPPSTREFLSLWGPSLGHPAPLPSVWLEFDLTSARSVLPAPLICAEVDGDADPDWVTGSLLPALRRPPESRAHKRAARRCLEEIPPEGRLLYAFGLEPRSRPAVRLEILGLRPAGMVRYLDRVAQSRAAQVARVAPLLEGCETLHLSLDLDEEVAPRVGLDASYRRLPYREPRWAELLDRLVAAGLAMREKRSALLDWPGVDTLWTAAERWPEAAVASGGYCVRSLSHVKLVTWPDRPPEAKGYLLSRYLPRSVAREASTEVVEGELVDEAGDWESRSADG